MIKVIDDKTILALIPRSDAAVNCQNLGGKDTSTCSYYAGDDFESKQKVKDFLSSFSDMYIDVKSVQVLIKELKSILRWYIYLYKGDISNFKKGASYFIAKKENIQITKFSTTGERGYYAFDNKTDEIIALRCLLYAKITEFLIVKTNNSYIVKPRLNKEWRKEISEMKVSQQEMLNIVNQFIVDNKDGRNIEEIAMLFGIKYAPIIRKNNIDVEKLVDESTFYNKEKAIDSLRYGMKISKDVIWESMETENEGVDEKEQEDVFSGFQPWLTTKNNPDYTGKEKYEGYARYLKRLVQFMNEKGLIIDADLNELDVEKYEDIQAIYYASPEAIEYDDKKLGTKGGIAALKKYIKYIDFLVKKGAGLIVDVNEKAPAIIDRKPRASKLHDFNQILYGAPGTGKTFATAEYAMAILEDRPVDLSQKTPEQRAALMVEYRKKVKEGKIVFTTFHQSYGYEDFIQGLRPETNNGNMVFNAVNGVFKNLAEKAMKDAEGNYVLIIDEINRGNISKIFGELITLIEDDKRWGEANQLDICLPSGEEFAVPNNLYIVGTMNSADKSIALIDTALRRRFKFVEVAPNPELVTDAVLKSVLEKLNEILRKQLDSSDLLIGHAYFLNKTTNDLVEILNGNIIPLLYEYFYDNANKVKDAISKAIEGIENIKFANNSNGRIKVE